MAHSITYTELDQLLVGHGFAPQVRDGRYLAYLDQSGKPVFIFPKLPPSDPVRSYHLAAVRRWFLDTEIMAEEEFDRWLCAMRFGELCRESGGTASAVERRSAD